MKFLSDKLIEIWGNQIRNEFQNGNLVYERQLQATLYHHLKQKLPAEYNIWIEPVIYLGDYGLDKVKPDIIITKENLVISIIELKHKPWELIDYTTDIKKLVKFEDATKSANEIRINLGLKPVSPKWKIQKNDNESVVSYNLVPDFLGVFISFCHPDSYSHTLSTLQIKLPSNFLHLYGSFLSYTEINMNHNFYKQQVIIK